jgi:hypothetical protein
LLPTFTRIVVDAADVTGLRVAAPALAEVRGKVTVTGGSRIPEDVRMMLALRTAGASVRIEIQSDGAFSIRLPYGDYQATIEGAPGELEVKSVRAGSQQSPNAPFKVDAPVVDLRIELGFRQ